MKKEFSTDTLQQDDPNFEVRHEEKLEDEIDPEYEKYKQNSFQDEVVDIIFEDILQYIKTNALPICEFMTKDDVEVIIDELAR